MRRRNATNSFLKECMADALLTLMKTKPFDAITVTEITELANVGRVTYYRNFKAKEDILFFKLSLLCEAWITEHLSQCIDQQDQAISYFKFIFTIKDIILQLYKSDLWHVLLDFFYQYLGPSEADTGEVAFRKAFYAYGILGVTTEWLKNGLTETPEMLGKFFVDKL